MKKAAVTALCYLALIAFSNTACAGETIDKAKETGKEIGTAFKDTFTEIGHNMRKAAGDVADEAVIVGHTVKKEVKKEFGSDKKEKKAEEEKADE